MHDVDLFQRALGLQEPWQVVDVQFDAEQRRLDLRIDFRKGSRFACAECDRKGCEVHDPSRRPGAILTSSSSAPRGALSYPRRSRDGLEG